MATRMLIDARHREETRVAVLKGNRIEEFDFESADHKQIKGNIYLAKVTRVEPSLQAAFVDFGGNRHGFLAFSEIHPDYYQIPHDDRVALLAEEQAHAEEEAALRAEEDDEDGDEGGERDEFDEEQDHSGVEEIDGGEPDELSTIEDGQYDNGEDPEPANDDEEAEGEEASDTSEEGGTERGRRQQRGRGRRQGGGGPNASRAKEMDDLRSRRQELRRRYKIQDVIQRRQVLLVQVVKEERGNKGAALTTYLSLAGRYCVLMPNSSHGGGISRKISSGADRKRLKQIVSGLELPRSMGLIVRTAGLQRTKPEIKRDFDYLARLWDEVREKTLAASAPALIHSDSDLIKRAIRDIYNREIEEVVVEGEEGFRSARAFMKLLMPSHVRRVKAYADPVPLFQRYGAEDQLSAMYDPVVQLKSGGYLVINPTEALVSIDINSGRSTKEHGIEQTALSTNMEAAREIARQLRLRDMAGLVVIDFIDMEHNSNTRKVEKCMKEALSNDRARIQIGRISGFGLMEMSRQRLRTGVLEATTRSCPHCDGTGLVRTASSAGLSALRLIEEEAAKGRGSVITLHASTEAAIYLLNAKRADLAEIESRYGVSVEVVPEGENEGAKMRVASSGPPPAEVPKFQPIVEEDDLDDYEDEIEDDEEEEEEPAEERRPREREAQDGGSQRKRRRRGGRNRSRERGDEGGTSEAESDSDPAEQSDGEQSDGEQSDVGRPSAEATGAEGEDAPRKRRRRGGRRRRRSEQTGENGEASFETGDENGEEQPGDGTSDKGETGDNAQDAPETDVTAAPEPAAAAEAATTDAGATDDAEPASEEAAPKPKRTRRKKVTEDAAAAPAEAEAEPTAEAAPEAEKPKRTRRRKPKAEEAADPDAAAPVEQAAEEAPAERAAQPAVPEAATPQAEAPGDVADAAAQSAAAAPEQAAEPAAKKAPAQAGAEAAADGDAENGGSARRGWWQRTFGT